MTETAPCRIGVLSDTHGHLPNEVFEIFKGVRMIFHAGDIGRDDILMELETIAPTHAVSGNIDGAPQRGRPLTCEVETPAGKIAMTHGHLMTAPAYNHDRLARGFGKFQPDIVIFGHSHIPHLSKVDGVWLFNPGSAGQTRFGKRRSVGLITATAEGPQFEHVAIE